MVLWKKVYMIYVSYFTFQVNFRIRTAFVEQNFHHFYNQSLQLYIDVARENMSLACFLPLSLKQKYKSKKTKKQQTKNKQLKTNTEKKYRRQKERTEQLHNDKNTKKGLQALNKMVQPLHFHQFIILVIGIYYSHRFTEDFVAVSLYNVKKMSCNADHYKVKRRTFQEIHWFSRY